MFAKQIAWARNVTPKDAIGGVSPYELQFGNPLAHHLTPTPVQTPMMNFPHVISPSRHNTHAPSQKVLLRSIVLHEIINSTYVSKLHPP